MMPDNLTVDDEADPRDILRASWSGWAHSRTIR